MRAQLREATIVALTRFAVNSVFAIAVLVVSTPILTLNEPAVVTSTTTLQAVPMTFGYVLELYAYHV